MDQKIIYTAGVVGLMAASVAAGRYLAPTKTIEKEKIVYQDKIVEKIVTVKDTDKKVNTFTVRLVTIKPDGTRTIETKTYDKSIVEITQKENSGKIESTDVTSDKEKIVENKKDDWLISVTHQFNEDPSYGLMVNRRILGPIWIGGFGFTDSRFGLDVGLSF